MKPIKVFQYWDSGIDNMPAMISHIYQHNLVLSKHYGFELIVIDQQNVKNYIRPITGFFRVDANFQSDIVRFFALHKYGGIWLDSDAVILNDLGEFFAKFKQTNYDLMLDEEVSNKVGCACLLAKAGTVCTNYCVQYIQDRKWWIVAAPYYDYLGQKERMLLSVPPNQQPSIPHKKARSFLAQLKSFLKKLIPIKRLKWEDLGPTNVTNLCRTYPDRVRINTAQKTAKGCNFISWQDTMPGDTAKWLLAEKRQAEEKAKEVFANTPYAMTWTIYNHKNFQNNAVEQVFNNELSVFHHLIKLSLAKIQQER